jgi:PAS domain S-box-containing protein
MSSDDCEAVRPQDVAAFLEHSRRSARRVSENLVDFSQRVRSLVSSNAPPEDPRDVLLAYAEERMRRLHEDLERACRYLEVERAKYLDELESTSDAHVETDARGVVREANRRASELFRLAPLILKGKLLIAFVARQDTKLFRERLRTVQQEGDDPSSFELRMRPRGGAVFRATLSVRPVRDLGGERAIGYRWSIRPVPAAK